MVEMKNKISCLDVAQYILSKLGTMTAMKLQKLVYYSQARVPHADKILHPDFRVVVGQQNLVDEFTQKQAVNYVAQVFHAFITQ